MTPLKRGQLLTEDDYLAKVEEYGDEFQRLMGAEGIRELLRDLDLTVEIDKLRKPNSSDRFRSQDQEDRQAPEGARGLPESPASSPTG
jgi:DNA-directed RNA polymerase beta' subunit